MNICFRVDASTIIGTGHVMRCLTLAEELKKNNHNVTFISRLHKGNLNHLITQKGFQVFNLKEAPNNNIVNETPKHAAWLSVTQEQDANETRHLLASSGIQFDWVIIDHYAIDITWQKEIRTIIPNIMVIDDLADRAHNCDLLLDQNYYLNANSRYTNLVPSNCRLLLGPKYALLRDEFINLHNTQKKKNNNPTALIFYGGSDPTNETLKAINAIKDKKIDAHVVVGPSNPNKEEIERSCKQQNITFHYNINYMAKLMHEVDFSICAGGSTTWERYCLGTPAIVTAVAYNQIELCENASLLAIDYYLGQYDTITQATIQNEIDLLLQRDNLSDLSEKAKKQVDGKGKQRVIELLKTLN
ncbi:UDP-2,4-diacetamido-2,4,6-trideoxy-beta-L-altropyranose hydrolase [Saliterribacillus persicus]|uniref:UDP-2,4-diacetamido-2,4, 6-trideoxy-beta-L-altropyranose hydrolase n=1 Tax=Saliterribacillus persicus TaxID=930114 RepID=A0A368YB51_9BACI|nr:UDP-2,4-diacetamido-2,4,6-trideoxy-beta-L-altropyranose hydrolase [Saliterribacillus persicus]RCW77355.1 UDP-2,4-diacetamido-2,4,6-trideoxy-beta-L-altropyranose hydrolase [Saliterribacillus persicus]